MKDKKGTKTKDQTTPGHEFWRVKVAEGKPSLDHHYKNYYVFADSVETAVKAALPLARQNSFSEPYCYLVEFVGYVAKHKGLGG